MNVNLLYQNLLKQIIKGGDRISTRNHETISYCRALSVTLTEFPLLSCKKVAWKKAIKEMEWFLSNNTKCPPELLDWWNGQLDSNNQLHSGYTSQFKWFTYINYENELRYFDQIKFIRQGLINNPHSRRLILTSWNPGEMSEITIINQNPDTPTTCHNTCTQFFVRNKKLYVTTYQRSADMLLGVPHNWVQTWALALYFAKHADLELAEINWTFGDAHIYNEESHLQAVEEILNFDSSTTQPIGLSYQLNEEFKAEDFQLIGNYAPNITIRPKLL